MSSSNVARRQSTNVETEKSSKRRCVDRQERKDVSVYCWGKTENILENQEPMEAPALRGENLLQVACGLKDAYILTVEGEVKRWGPSAEEGGWDSVNHSNRTVIAESVLPGIEIKSLTNGPHHFAAVASNGALYTWGCGRDGKLGHGTERREAKPKVVEMFNGVTLKVKMVDCGTCHTVALSTGGDVYTFGSNSCGRTGHNTQRGKLLVPLRVERLAALEIAHVAAGGCHTAAVTERSRRVFTWGKCGHGVFGHEDEVASLFPKEVDRLLNVRVNQVFCGGNHTAVLTYSGAVYMWGNNNDGQLGNGTDEEGHFPAMIKGLESIEVQKVVLGRSNSMAFTSDGACYVWGSSSVEGDVQGSASILLPERLGAMVGRRVFDAVSFGFNGFAVLVNGSEKLPANDFVPIATALNASVGDDQFSDVTFMVGMEHQKTVHAHRIILVQKCEYFRKMFDNFRESSKKVISIPHVEPEIFELMLRYLYTDKVYVGLENAIQLLNLAEMYCLERLKTLCCRGVRQKLAVETVTPLLKMAVDSQCTAIKDICMDYIVSNYVQVATTEGLRRLGQVELLEIIQLHARRLQDAEPRIRRGLTAGRGTLDAPYQP